LTAVVLDASVAGAALIESTASARALHQRLAEEQCHAPHLIDAEVGSLLRRRVAARRLERDVAAAALRAITDLVHERYPHGPLAPVAWSLRHTLTYYDALYIALAARLHVPLLTADARLAGAPDLPCEVELVASTRPIG
jgi:predicted nucleic acid-binding protein